MQVELGYALIPVKVGRHLKANRPSRAPAELGRRIARHAEVVPRAYGVLVRFISFAASSIEARHVADQCLGVARQHDDVDSADRGALPERHRVPASWANSSNGLSDLEECIRRYGPDERSIHRMLYGQDAKASALGWLSMALWCLGEPDAALARARESLALVRDSPQPFLLARGLAGVGFVHVFRGEPQGADSPLQQALALCAEHGFGYFHAIVAAFAGANLVVLSRPIEEHRANAGKHQRASNDRLGTIADRRYWVTWHQRIARCSRRTGSSPQSRTGSAAVGRNGEHWGEAELHRIQGHLLLTRGALPFRGSREASYRTALESRRPATRTRLSVASGHESRALSSARGQRQRRASHRIALPRTRVGAWPNELDSPDLSRARKAMQLLQPDEAEPGHHERAAIDPRHR